MRPFSLCYYFVLLLPAGAARGDIAEVEPIIWDYCFNCHGDGEAKGGIDLEEQFSRLDDGQIDLEIWVKVWENLTSGMMPPPKRDHPSSEERSAIKSWIARDLFRYDSENPDPGRVTIRRLNRQEYNNAVHDIFGTVIRPADDFPPDDTGYGFDTIGDVLGISPLLFEKYYRAADLLMKKVVYDARPSYPREAIDGYLWEGAGHQNNIRFRAVKGLGEVFFRLGKRPPGRYRYRIRYEVAAREEGDRQIWLQVRENDRVLQQTDHDPIDDADYFFEGEVDLTHPDARLVVSAVPHESETPPEDFQDVDDSSFRRFEIELLELEGPLEDRFFRFPPAYDRIFFEGEPNSSKADREAYARRILNRFGSAAFRKPLDHEEIDRLIGLYRLRLDEGGNFKDAVGHALTAVLVSPRFLLRSEVQPNPNDASESFPLNDFELASRLSFLLWSSVPDRELRDAAAAGTIRSQLDRHVKRMLADPKTDRFIANFVGQWLLTRDVEVFGLSWIQFPGIAQNVPLRKAMRDETEMLFKYLMREDKDLLELLSADYTFLNEELAKHYNIPGVEGEEMRKVVIPEGAPRRGILTHAGVLIVTSNPSRTSPVKRGMFVLDNILGIKTPPPPEDVPDLPEESEKELIGTMRELMVQHRENPKCNSCHSRMDPIGLALENFDLVGRWRDDDMGRPIDASGKLPTGESFQNALDLQEILIENHSEQFYRVIVEKLMVYALGRGIEYYDLPTIDRIARRLAAEGGKFSTLIKEIVYSNSFLMRRGDPGLFKAPDHLESNL